MIFFLVIVDTKIGNEYICLTAPADSLFFGSFYLHICTVITPILLHWSVGGMDQPQDTDRMRPLSANY